MYIEPQYKETVVFHMYSGILLDHKKEWNLTICNHMDEPWEYCAQSVRKRQKPYDFTYIWNLKK